MEQNLTNPNAWYEKTWLVIVLCIIFFPVGLYALWKNSSIAKGWKIVVTLIIALIVIANVGDNKKAVSSSETKKAPVDNTANDIQVEESKPDVEILKQSATYEETMSAYTIHCRVRNNTDELITYVDLKFPFVVVWSGIGVILVPQLPGA